MPRTIRIAGLALLIAGLVAGLPAYAQEPTAPPDDPPAMMQQGGDEMMQMMTACTKMMEGMMMMQMGQESDQTGKP